MESSAHITPQSQKADQNPEGDCNEAQGNKGANMKQNTSISVQHSTRQCSIQMAVVQQKILGNSIGFNQTDARNSDSRFRFFFTEVLDDSACIDGALPIASRG